jgi:hypothetical protein
MEDTSLITLIKENSGLRQPTAQFVRVHGIVRPSPVSTMNTARQPLALWAEANLHFQGLSR